MDTKSHWERVYRTYGPEQLSWFQPEASMSLKLIQQVAADRDSTIIDVGAGASRLVDGLLAAGYRRITVVDLSSAALAYAQQRLGRAGSPVVWKAADILTVELPAAGFDVWHDRAVFHFLTGAADRGRYVTQVRHAVRRNGHVIVATFAETGPPRCSGLDVARYSPNSLQAEFGSAFRLLESRVEDHKTPRGATQAFTYCLFRHEPTGVADVS